MAQQERAIRTRHEIVKAAAILFGEFGYNGTSTTDIIARSGVTRGALYFHFPSKEAVAEAVVDFQDGVLVPPVRKVVLQSIIAMSYKYADGLIHDPQMRGAVRLSVEQATFRNPDATPYESPERAVVGLLRQAEDAGELLPGTDPSAVARLLVGAFTGIQLFSEAATHRQDLRERLSDLWRYLLPGLAVPGLLPHLRVPEVPEG